jgi:hypothetical protein
MSSMSLELKGVSQHFQHDNLSNILEFNLKTYYDWSLLSLGAWNDVTIPTSGVYGGDFSRLRLVQDANYTSGCVWEAAKKDFVWESGVNYTGVTGNVMNPQPVGQPVVGGVTITTGYYVDYPNGRLIFENAINVTGVVKLPYAYRYVQVYRADDAPWWRQIQYHAHRVDSTQFLQSASGEWSIFGVNRVQLPAVVIEVVPRGFGKGWELGSDSLEQVRDVQFHILAENSWDRNNLMDIFNCQVDRKIHLFNSNSAVSDWPLDYRGMLTGSKNYPYFVSETGHRWRVCEFKESFITDVRQLHPNLYVATVRTITETIV